MACCRVAVHAARRVHSFVPNEDGILRGPVTQSDSSRHIHEHRAKSFQNTSISQKELQPWPQGSVEQTSAFFLVEMNIEVTF